MTSQPSQLLGLTSGSYEAYCLDQAVWYLGISITQELDKVGHKRQKGEAQNEAGRKRVLTKYLGNSPEASSGTYADPSALFG